MLVAVLVAVGIGLARGLAEPGGGADRALVDVAPPGARPHEGLVVEAGRQQWAQPVAERAEVELERRPAVLAVGDQPVVQLDLGSPDVGLGTAAATELDQRVGLLRSGRDDAARAMVLEATSDQMNAVGEQGRGERVAGEALVARAVEGEAEPPPTVDPPALRQAVSRRTGTGADVAHGASSPRDATSVRPGRPAAGVVATVRRSIFGRGSPIG
ncbi:MAG: hypothetical protein K0S35_3730 [Geminicoccaceae bacterium]|nr:hypothetical protein [Geminicoccaceae bacterium]